jgi:hypothetical protein
VAIEGVVTVTEIAKPPVKKIKVPTPRFHYSLATVAGSQEANLMQRALRGQLTEMGVSLFAIGHEDGNYDVMGDSGAVALKDDDLRDARAMADKIKKAG